MFLASVAIFFCSLSWMNAAEANQIQTRQILRVQLNKLDVVNSEKYMRWELTITNENPQAIRISRFSLESVLGAIVFKDRSGRSWQVELLAIISDPPPPDVDYSLTVKGNGSVKAIFQTRLLKQIRSENTQKRQKGRTELIYEFKDTVGVADAKSWKPSSWDCVGKGIILYDDNQ